VRQMPTAIRLRGEGVRQMWGGFSPPFGAPPPPPPNFVPADAPNVRQMRGVYLFIWRSFGR
jgi:hypothetical protein